MKNAKKLALVLALALAFALVGCGAEPAPAPAPEAPEAPVEDVKGEGVMTHEEYMAAELETEVVVEAYVQAKQSYYAEKGTATIYAQDKDGAYFLYNAAVSAEDYEKLVPGTKIKAKGFKAEWSGEVEVIDSTVEILEGNFVAEALDATELLASEDLIKHQNEFVSFKGLTVADSGDGKAFLYNWDGSGSQGDDVYFKASVNDQTYTFVVESYLCNKDSDTYKAVEALKVGDVIDLEGFLYWYEGAQPHVTSVTVK